jgi:hypothetical protein
VGSQIYNGKPFYLTAQGWVKAHGTSQTVAFGFQGAKYTTGAFSGTQLGTGTASGTLTAGNVYPFLLQATLFADNTSGILSGYYSVVDGVTPTYKSNAVLAATLTGVNFGTNNATNATNPLASAQTPALQFALTFTNSVSDTTEVVSVSSFFVSNDN